MSENRKCFTMIWKIKNFIFSFNRKIVFNLPFFVLAMGKTEWVLKLSPNSDRFKDCVACYFDRADDDRGPDLYELDYELSFLANDGSVLHSEIFLEKVFKKGSLSDRALYMKRDEVYLLRKDAFIPDDTLTIRCRMWDRRNPMSQSGRCFAESQIETECRTFIGVINKFSNTATSTKNLGRMISPTTETFVSSMNLCVASDGKLVIEIKLMDRLNIKMNRCKIFIQDIFGNKVKFGQSEFHNTTLQSITLTLLKEHLMENKEYYLPNDVLTLECDVIFPTGNKIHKIVELEYGIDCGEPRKFFKIVTNSDSEKDEIEKLTTLKDDMISLFSEGILCDTTIKTATETFAAHRIVLSARSPVFKSMFTTDMREKTNNCVDIDDLDPNTVRRMLSFLYSDTLDDLQYDSAKNLYFAADKYNIVSLRHQCSNFLKQNLLHSNCCDTLILADKHQDTKLRSAVQDYIARNDEEVIFSDEWKNLEKSHPHLTTEIFRFIYLKKRKN